MFFDLLRRSLEEVVEELVYPAKTLKDIYSFREPSINREEDLLEEIARSLGIEKSSDLRELVKRVLEEEE
ncbi:hypothetical protein EYM_06645 [Ignicoccus islandicus DSM 13165]|uniref:Uncharacterized protein n=1 Tax=Ignicoccus islandicus DSM 13165 TaxID=940295 RepID=A0A0U2VFD4_9CREN|nr:hypothetical protein [Ignicoccus islandicus]ALU12706.1 hypothetical protein EYM_06645 [Ignicoccus islandicus DSM 13165]